MSTDPVIEIRSDLGWNHSSGSPAPAFVDFNALRNFSHPYLNYPEVPTVRPQDNAVYKVDAAGNMIFENGQIVLHAGNFPIAPGGIVYQSTSVGGTSLNDVVSKRMLEAVERVSEAIEQNEITLKTGEFAVRVVVEAMLPFCTRDVVELGSKLASAYAQKVRDQEIEEELEREKTRIVTPVTATDDMEAW